jgi:hypothetical protein
MPRIAAKDTITAFSDQVKNILFSLDNQTPIPNMHNSIKMVLAACVIHKDINGRRKTSILTVLLYDMVDIYCVASSGIGHVDDLGHSINKAMQTQITKGQKVSVKKSQKISVPMLRSFTAKYLEKDHIRLGINRSYNKL